MLNNTNYEQLKSLLQEEGYEIYVFVESNVNTNKFIREYFSIDTNRYDYSITVFNENNIIEIFVEEEIEDYWHLVEQKFFMNVKDAFNKIKQLMNN